MAKETKTPRTEVTRNVPANRLEFTKDQFKKAGATKVEDKETPPGSGKFTVTATFNR